VFFVRKKGLLTLPFTQLFGALLLVMLVIIALGVIFALIRYGFEEIAALLAAPFLELPSFLRLPAFLLTLWVLWAGFQALTPRTPIVVPTTVIEAGSSHSTVFLPFVGR